MNLQCCLVLGNRDQFSMYIHRPVCRELLRLRLASEAAATCSVAAVMKSNGKEQHNIHLTCPPNEIVVPILLALGRAYDYGMQAGAALG